MASLKRTADGNEFDSILSSKRAALGASAGDNSNEAQYNLLKMLCPNMAIGSIIGKGGSVINQLNQSTGAKIKLSQNHEFYPATNDRVIAITGSQEAIGVALSELISKMLEVPDRKHENEKFPTPARPFQVRLLIPIGASGVLIGRQGAVIKRLAEQTSCNMQLSELAEAYDTKERIMIINSKNSSIKDLISGAQIAATQLFSEPQLCTYSNIRPSYEPSEDLHQQHQGDNLGGQGMGRRPSMNDNNRDGGLSPYTSQYPHTQPQQMSQPYGQQLQLQQQGAMYQLAGSSPYSLQHGISGPNLGIVGVGGGYGVFDNMSQQHQNSSFNQQQMMQQQQQQRHGFGHQMNSQMNYNQPNFGQNQRQGQGQGQNQAPRYPNDQYGGNNRGSQSYQHQQQNHQTSDYNSNNQSALNDVSPPVFSTDGASITMTMGVPDSLVGAILGRSGCVVKEIMSLSGTQIQISQKDAVGQGQNDKLRQVKVIGLQHQVQVAQSMIMAKMQSQPPQQGGR